MTVGFESCSPLATCSELTNATMATMPVRPMRVHSPAHHIRRRSNGDPANQ
jgi:hypothetical protein